MINKSSFEIIKFNEHGIIPIPGLSRKRKAKDFRKVQVGPDDLQVFLQCEVNL